MNYKESLENRRKIKLLLDEALLSIQKPLEEVNALLQEMTRDMSKFDAFCADKDHKKRRTEKFVELAHNSSFFVLFKKMCDDYSESFGSTIERVITLTQDSLKLLDKDLIDSLNKELFDYVKEHCPCGSLDGHKNNKCADPSNEAEA